MLLLPAILLVAMTLALALGGRFRNLAARRIRLWWLALVGLALQVVPLPSMPDEAAGVILPLVLALSSALIVIVAVANRRETGFALVAIGFAMNFAVISANGGMPVSADAARAAGADPEALERLRDAPGKHHLATDEDMLRPLGDVIGIGPPVRAVVSVGDVLAYVGAGVWLGVSMTRGPRPRDWSGRPPAPGAKSSGTLRRRSSPRRERSRS